MIGLLSRWLHNGVIPWMGVFLGVFLGLELPARDVLGVWPWPSLSEFIWNSIRWWHVVALIVAAFMAVLLGHFEWHWAARWLIAVAVLAAVSVGIRALVGVL